MGGIEAVWRLYIPGAIQSTYKRVAMTSARDGPDIVAYFAPYEYYKRCLTPKDPEGNEGPLNFWLLV